VRGVRARTGIHDSLRRARGPRRGGRSRFGPRSSGLRNPGSTNSWSENAEPRPRAAGRRVAEFPPRSRGLSLFSRRPWAQKKRMGAGSSKPDLSARFPEVLEPQFRANDPICFARTNRHVNAGSPSPPPPFASGRPMPLWLWGAPIVGNTRRADRRSTGERPGHARRAGSDGGRDEIHGTSRKAGGQSSGGAGGRGERRPKRSYEFGYRPARPRRRMSRVVRHGPTRTEYFPPARGVCGS